MTALHIDFETRSTADLKEVGLWNYARHPDTSPWCMAWVIGDMEPGLWRPGLHQDYADQFLEHVSYGWPVIAHNAAFELAIWNEIMVPRYGWPVLKPEQTFCTMAQAYAMALPGALEDAALALGLSVLKDAEGRALMLRIARPRSYLAPAGKGDDGVPIPVWWDEPEKLKRLYAYCQQDVRVERELHKRLMPLSDRERKVWLLDYRINQRGVQIDLPSAKAAIKLAEYAKEKSDKEIARLTDGAVTAATAVAALKDWLAANGLPEAQDGLAKQDVTDFLARDVLPDAVRAVLTLRQEGGKASTAKFGKMVAMAGDDGRLRNMYQYHGAGTGRWAGRAVQTHNLVRDMPKVDVVEKVLDLVRKGEFDAIDVIFGSPLTMVSRCLRSFFVAPPGKLLVSGDFANVEGRGQAWFAGEAWKLKAFAEADAGTGPGLYELAYSRMFHVPVESVKNPSEERQVGKVAELAFGYQGGVGSFHTMGKNYNVKVSDDDANRFKEAWRDAHPAIAGTINTSGYRTGGVWRQIENAAISAVRHPGEAYACGYPGRVARFKVVGSFLWCLLPSGRAICYPYPKILQGQYGPMLTYMTQPSQDDRKKMKVIDDPKNSSNWVRIGTYSGSLFNNIVQGFCRDLLVECCLLPLDAAGAAVVLHTHDDGNIEVDAPKAEDARSAMEKMMRAPPEWALGFPLYAECKVMTRYGK